MRRFFALFLLFALSVNADGKPFGRVLVLTGGSLEFGTHLGVWRGLQKAGWNPDLVITTCGSSMLSTLIQSQPDPQAVEDTFFSEEYFEALKGSAHVDKGSGLRALSRVYLVDDLRHFPRVFGRTILDVSLDSPLPSFSKTFDANHPRVLMVASRLKYGPEAQGRSWSALGEGVFEEVFFTDDDTAARIPPFISPLASWSSRVAPQTEVLTGWDVWTAFRVSIADPYLLAPVLVGSEYYATGAIDIVPVELALELGDDVLIASTGEMEDANSRGFENFFGFNQNERTRVARSVKHENIRWIDLQDDVRIYKKNGISPVIDGMLPIPGHFLRIKDRMPKTHEEFVRRMRVQYEYGAERAIRALQ